ncbi:MAG: hypothetical protein ACYC9X_00765 [Dehalococcoidia bacterium]
MPRDALDEWEPPGSGDALDNWQPPPPAAKPEGPGSGEAIALGAAKGASLGWGNRLAAVLPVVGGSNAPTYRQRVSDDLASMNRTSDAAQAAHPVKFGLSALVAGIPIALATGGGGEAASGTGWLARMANALGAGTPVTAGRVMTQGAVLGGLSSAADAQPTVRGAGEVAQGVIDGALFARGGQVVGEGLGGVAATLGPRLRGLASRIAGKLVGGDAALGRSAIDSGVIGGGPAAEMGARANALAGPEEARINAGGAAQEQGIESARDAEATRIASAKDDAAAAIGDHRKAAAGIINSAREAESVKLDAIRAEAAELLKGAATPSALDFGAPGETVGEVAPRIEEAQRAAMRDIEKAAAPLGTTRERAWKRLGGAIQDLDDQGVVVQPLDIARRLHAAAEQTAGSEGISANPVAERLRAAALAVKREPQLISTIEGYKQRAQVAASERLDPFRDFHGKVAAVYREASDNAAKEALDGGAEFMAAKGQYAHAADAHDLLERHAPEGAARLLSDVDLDSTAPKSMAAKALLDHLGREAPEQWTAALEARQRYASLGEMLKQLPAAADADAYPKLLRNSYARLSDLKDVVARAPEVAPEFKAAVDQYEKAYAAHQAASAATVDRQAYAQQLAASGKAHAADLAASGKEFAGELSVSDKEFNAQLAAVRSATKEQLAASPQLRVAAGLAASKEPITSPAAKMLISIAAKAMGHGFVAMGLTAGAVRQAAISRGGVMAIDRLSSAVLRAPQSLGRYGAVLAQAYQRAEARRPGSGQEAIAANALVLAHTDPVAAEKFRKLNEPDE